MARFRHYSHPAPSGILGTFPANPEVIAVFPELSSTVDVHAQELRLRRGDDLDLDFQLQNDGDPPDQVLLDGAVVRFAVKQGYGQTERFDLVVGNEGALIIKRNADPSHITLDGGGRGTVHIKRADTRTLPLSPAVWDLEVTRPAEAIPIPAGGSVQVVNLSPMVTAIGFTWPAELAVGDIFEAQNRRVLITRIVSPVHIEVDWSEWTTAIVPASAPACGPEFCVTRGITKTVATGPAVIQGDVVL